ncbi:S-layer protein domain-containing protein [Methanococcoides vulcani]|nr:S-layer protein domain-containing protein [Methanococcoides vulcani]
MSAGLVSAYDADTNDDGKLNFIKFDIIDISENRFVPIDQTKILVDSNIATVVASTDLGSSNNSSSGGSGGGSAGNFTMEGSRQLSPENEIRGPVFTGNFSTWNNNSIEIIDAQDFAGFYYDLDDDLSGETLTLYQNGTLNSRVLDSDAVQNPLVYATSAMYSSPKFEFMLENNSSVPLSYQTVGFMGEQYASIIQDNVAKLSPLLIDTDDRYTLRLNQTLELGEGYAITPKQIDVDGEKVWLELTRNGGFIDDEIISTGANETTSNRTWYYEQEVLGENVVTLIVHVDEVFQDQDDSLCVIEGIWQISDQVTEVDLGDKYGKMIVSSVDNTSIIMELDDDIVLDAGSTNNLMENFEFRVADETTLRFYLRKTLTESGIYEIRGTVVDSPSSNETYSWNAHSFAGFWYDFDNNATSEVLTVHGIDNLDRTIDANLGELIYTATIVYDIQPKFDFKTGSTDWTYEKIGFLGEEYIPIEQDPQILTKLLIDDDSSNLIGVGHSLNLSEGYVVTPKQIDVTGDKVWLELTKNGTFLDDDVINASTNATTSDKTWYYKQDILNETDVLTLIIHVDEVNQSGNFIIIDGIWQISDDFMEIADGEEFGKMEIIGVSTNAIELRSTEDIVLDAGSTNNLTDNFALRVADDSSNLRFYPFIEYNVINEITVDDSGGQDYATIQAAVGNATDGDTILVYPGTYTENVYVNKELTFISQSGNPFDTIVQAADPNNHVFYVTADNVTICGFNVTGATGGFGIGLGGLEGCTIAGNSLSNNDYGIWLGQSINNTLSSNIVSNNSWGIVLFDSSDNNTLSNNTASSNNGDGIYLDSSSDNMLGSNIVSNNDYGIVLFDSSGNNTLSNNIVSNNGDGIWLFGSSGNNTLSNNIVSNNGGGIWLFGSSGNNTLSNNTASSNSEAGICLFGSSNNTLNDNTASSNSEAGIYLNSSSDNMLSSNIVSNNYWGIWLDQSSDNNLLSNNTANSNTDCGIGLLNSSNNMLNDNTANSNNEVGIGLMNSSNNTLSSNIVSNNSDGGVYLEDSSNSLIYNNYFNNTNNVEYNGTNTGNIWNITMTVGTNIVGGPLLGGNYWVHPNGTGFSLDTADSNKDGICDEQCNLSGTEIDYLPLSIVVDNLLPVISITSPADGYSTTASSIAVSGLVNGTGSLPLVTVNDIAAETTILDFNGTFTATVPLAMGTNTIYANVTDAAGNTNTTYVNVTRISSGGNGGGGGGGGSGATGEAFENIAFKEVKTENIVGGLEISYTFDDEQNAIEYINFSALRNYGRVSTTVEVLKNRSAMVDESAPGVVYSNLNIWVGKSGFATEDNIADPVIGFCVAKAWLIENGIDENSIALYRHNEGKWNVLNTMKVGEDGEYIYFEAETPGFSPFAITGQKSKMVEEVPEEKPEGEVVEEEPEEEPNGIPWISTGLLILILVGVHLLMRKRG